MHINQDEIGFANQRLESQDQDDIDNINPDWKQSIGELLYRSVFVTKELQELYNKSVETAENEGKGIRFQFNIENPEIANYPWELICRDGNYLSIEDTFSVTRLIPGAKGRKKEIKTPLRILIIGSNPTIPNTSSVTVDREVDAIHTALRDDVNTGTIKIEKSTGRIQDILDKLEQTQFNIIHFIGHGIFENDTGFLALEDERGKLVKADQNLVKIILSFNQTKTCGLVVLNACQGAATSTSKAFTGLAPELLKRGFPCVIAMRYSISNKMSNLFSQQFYKNLTSSPIDENLQKVRKRLLALPDSEPRDFFSPVLYTNPDEKVVFSTSNVSVIEPAWASQFLIGYYDVVFRAGILSDFTEHTLQNMSGSQPDYNALMIHIAHQIVKVGQISDRILDLKEKYDHLSTNEDLKKRISAIENLLNTFSQIQNIQALNSSQVTQQALQGLEKHRLLQKELKDLYSEIINGIMVL